jgi:hypothetical protein
MTEVELVTTRWSRRRAATESTPLGIARVGTPVVEPVSDRSGSAFRLAVELDANAADAHFVAAFLRVDFTDAGVKVIELRLADTSASDVSRAAGPVATSVSVLRGGMFGWLMGDPLGSTPVPHAFTAHAVLSVPAGVSALTVTARVDATLVRAGRWHRRSPRFHACSRTPVEFTLQLPVDEAGTPAEVRSVTRPDRRGGAVRLCLAADIQQFSRFRTPEAMRAQQRFVEVLAEARRYAGIEETEVEPQESGDGQFAVLPHGLDESTVVPRLIEGLRIALAHVNSDLNEHARLRLRVALHRGHIAPGANGWVGESSIAIHRILDSEAVRTALVTNTSADFALIVPEVLYREVVCQRYEQLDPDEFVHVEVKSPAKGFTAEAWVYLPRR